MIYFLQRADGLVKIGTTGNLLPRFARLSREHGELESLGVMDGSYPLERALHVAFGRSRVIEEWFTLTPDLAKYIEVNTSQINLVLQPKAIMARHRTRLQQLREKQGLTRMDVMRQANVSYQTVFRWESHVLGSVDRATLKKLTDFFGVDESELIYEVAS